MRGRPHPRYACPYLPHRCLRAHLGLHVLHEFVECVIGNCPQFGRRFHLTQVTTKHDPEVTGMLDGERHISIKKCLTADIGGLACSGSERIAENLVPLGRDCPEESPAILEVVVRRLVADACIDCNLPQRKRIGPLRSDVIDGGQKNRLTQTQRHNRSLVATLTVSTSCVTFQEWPIPMRLLPQTRTSWATSRRFSTKPQSSTSR